MGGFVDAAVGGPQARLEKPMTDVLYLLLGVAVLALFAGYAALLRRA